MIRKSIILVTIFLIGFTQPVFAQAEQKVNEELMYNILIDRFNNGNQSLSEQVDIEDPLAYHGGDLKGITKKLNHLKQLGFTSITLSPIMANAPKGYHGYWIEDFYEVEEQFGTMEELNDLIEEAHNKGIKVILELVTNYVSSSHEIVKDPNKKDWIKENAVETTPSTEWLNDTAVLDQENDHVQEYLLDVATYWMKETNIDGFKLHAADQMSPSFLTDLTETIHQLHPDFYILASLLTENDHIDFLYENPYIDAIENVQMFKDMNDVFTDVDNPVNGLYETLINNENEFKNLIYVDNENTARFSNNFAEKGRNALTTWQLALTFMYTAPGVPLVYQGSELPMYGPGFPESQMLVLFNDANPDIEEFYERISAIRGQFPALAHGDIDIVGTDGGMTVIKRTYKDEIVYVAINNDSESRMISETGIDSDIKLRGLLGDNTVIADKNGEFKIGIPRESVEIYYMEENTGFNWGFIAFVIGVMLTFIFAVIFLRRKQKQEEASN